MAKQKKFTRALRSEVGQEFMTSEKRFSTTGDWYPTYEDGTVRGRIFLQSVLPRKNPNEYWVRVCFWGADDFGMELDEDLGTDLAMARARFEYWSEFFSNQTFVEKEQLHGLGFIRA